MRIYKSEDPSSLSELGASPFGLRPHKTTRHTDDGRLKWENRSRKSDSRIWKYIALGMGHGVKADTSIRETKNE